MTASSKAPDPAGSVPALAAQVADLRGIVVGLRARVDTAGSTSNLKLAERLEVLAGTVRHLTDEGPAPTVTAPVWHDLDPAQHAAQVADLAAWVDGFLTVNYPHVPLRPCWPDHPAALWELSTLHAEWARVYGRDRPPLAGALDWHENHLPGVIARLPAILKDCKGKCSLVRSAVRALPQPQPRAG